MTKIFTISEEMLDSLASEYMTPDAAAIIVNQVKTQRTILTNKTSTFELKFAMALAYKSVFQWITFCDAPDQRKFPRDYEDNREAWDSTCDLMHEWVCRLFPALKEKDEAYLFLNMTRGGEEKTTEEKEWHDNMLQLYQME